MIKNLLMTAAVAAMALSASAETKLALTLDDLGSGWNSSYDAATHTITYEDSWSGKGWWLGSADYSDYDKVVVEFAECNVPVQIVVEYNNGVTGGASGCVAIGSTEVEQALSEEGKADVMQIYLQCGDITGIENPTVTLSAAYLVGDAEYNPIIFDGEMVLSGWSGNEIAASKFALAEVGDRMVVTCKTTEGGSFKINLVDSGWNWVPMTSFADCEGYSAEYETIWVSEDSEVECILDEGDVERMLTGHGAQVQGDGVTITQIAIYKAEAEAQYIYVVGDFQNWDINNPLIVEGIDNVYGFEAEGISAFKFSTVYDGDNWELFNSGAYTINTNAVIGENALVPGDWNIALPWAGDYTIVIDLNNMIIELATDTPEPVVDTTIYLRGYMNDWGADEAYAFTEGEDGLYTLTLSMVEEGVEFKFATEDWETVDMGGVLDMLPGIVYTLTWHEASNCSLARTLYDVTFTLDVDASTVIVDGTTGIESVAADAENAVYYNLQGVRVANPERGTFVKVVNGKATKVAF